ncbi:hypothetical protein ACJX0J_030792, partial [Zea mays]
FILTKDVMIGEVLKKLYEVKEKLLMAKDFAEADGMHKNFGETYDYGDEILSKEDQLMISSILAPAEAKVQDVMTEPFPVAPANVKGNELFEEDISELKEFAIAGGYKLGSILGKNCQYFIKDNYRRQHIIGSLFYSNFKANPTIEQSFKAATGKRR